MKRLSSACVSAFFLWPRPVDWMAQKSNTLKAMTWYARAARFRWRCPASSIAKYLSEGQGYRDVINTTGRGRFPAVRAYLLPSRRLHA